MLCWAWSKSRLQEQKNPIRTKFIQWSARDGALVIEKKELLFPHYPPVNVKLLKMIRYRHFAIYPPKLTKKAILKLNDANLSPQKKKQNKILDKTKDKPVVFLCSICLKWSLITPQAPQIPPRPPNPITLWTKNKHRILLFIYEKRN